MIGKGDLIAVPGGQGQRVLGQAIEVMGGVFLLATFEVGRWDARQLDSIELGALVFLVQTMDQAVRDGRWEIVGNRVPDVGIEVPRYLVPVGLGGELFVQDLYGEIVGPATAEDVASLAPYKSYSPALVEWALAARAGAEEWLDRFDEMLAGSSPS
ncbi:hypothetical protein OG474_24705 [Kribbella sp. NBC_01505]|uniref:hypothetical protein n=1 Tax=Kribbella sp. NBC_01505 TaxID=2903580 RepID=UPI00386F77D7